MTGVFLAVAAQLKLASMLTFVSRSVMIGYITAAALLIGTLQLHHLTATKLTGDPATFIDAARYTFFGLSGTNPQAVAVAALTLVLIHAIKKWLPWIPAVSAALVLVSALAAVLAVPVPYLQGLPPGGLQFSPPQLNFSWFQQLVAPAIALAFLSSLESVVMAKTLASRTGTPVNVNQEAFSVGIANIASAFAGGMVASGSLTRSALNAESGASSPLASIMNGLICLVIAVLIGQFIDRIPVAALAMVVTAVAVSLIDVKSIRVALKSTKSDAIVLAVTFCAALLVPLDTAIFIGVAASLVLYLRKAGTPQLVEYTFNDEGNLSELEGRRRTTSITIIHVEGELFFGAADLFRDQVRKICMDESLKVIILRMRNARHLDATTVFALQDLISYLRSTGRHLLVSGASRDVYRVFRNSGLLDVLGKRNFFPGLATNPNLSTRNALKRAQELLGGEKADVRIYADPAKQKTSSVPSH
jgi:SulP family sulfate permease